LGCIALLLCLDALNPALAASAPTPGETDLIRERQDRLLEEQRKRLDDLQELPGKQNLPAAPTAPAEARCFNIQHIDIKGADHLPRLIASN
jgi:hemolysin activation/secretion protein